jgi:hypothetical protein
MRISKLNAELNLQLGTSSSYNLKEKYNNFTSFQPNIHHIAYAVDTLGEYLPDFVIYKLQESLGINFKEDFLEKRDKKILSSAPLEDYMNEDVQIFKVNLFIYYYYLFVDF